MNNIKLINEIRKVSVTDNIDAYRELLELLPRGEAKDPFWIKLLDYYDRSTDSDKEFLFAIMQQVATDSTASVLAVIDGSTYADLDSELKLTDEDGNQLGEDLSDLFLEASE